MKINIITLLFLLFGSIAFSQTRTTKISNNRFLQQSNNKYGVIDSLNQIIIPFNYDFIEYKNTRLILRINELNGLYSLDNEEIIPIAFSFILPRAHNRFILWSQDSSFGLVDQNGKIIIPLKYKSVSSIENDDYYITQNEDNLEGIFDYNGNIVFPEEYKLYTIDGYKLFASKGNQAYILDIQKPDSSKSLNPEIFLLPTLRHYAGDEPLFQIVKKQGKFGLINSENEIIVPLIYEEVSSSEHWSHYFIKLGGKIGLINIEGKIVRKPIYDRISLRKEHVILHKKGMKDEIYSYNVDL